MAKQTSNEAAQEKKNGTLRAQFIRQHCVAWMKQNKPTILAKFQEAALAKHPKSETKPEFVLDESLLNLQEGRDGTI